MNGRRRKRPSLLPFGRNRFILGILLIFAVSFGVVYYFAGPKEGSQAKRGTEVSGGPESTVAVSPENKKVLPPASTDTPANSPSDKSPHPSPGGSPDTSVAGATGSPVKPATEDKVNTQTVPGGAERPGQVPQPRAETAQAVSAPGGSQAADKAGQGSPKAPEPAPEASQKASAKKLYTIQFGALPTKDEAERLKKKLQSQGLKAYIVNRGEDDPLFRVRAGTFKSKKEAERRAAAIHQKTRLSYFVTVK